MTQYKIQIKDLSSGFTQLMFVNAGSVNTAIEKAKKDLAQNHIIDMICVKNGPTFYFGARPKIEYEKLYGVKIG